MTATQPEGLDMTDDELFDLHEKVKAELPNAGDLGSYKRMVIAFARALLASKTAVPEGFKLVPVEPTREMIDAGFKKGTGARHVYAAMLAASPTAPAQPCGEPCSHDYVRSDKVCTECGEQADEAMTIKVDKDRFDQLMDALDRAESKGYMPDAIGQRWSAFEWEIVPPSRAKDSK